MNEKATEATSESIKSEVSPNYVNDIPEM